MNNYELNTQEIINKLKEQKVDFNYIKYFINYHITQIKFLNNSLDVIFTHPNGITSIIIIDKDNDKIYVSDSQGSIEFIQNSYQLLKSLNNNGPILITNNNINTII